jgi:hypothetical protein
MVVVAGELNREDLVRLMDELLQHNGRISHMSEIHQYLGLDKLELDMFAGAVRESEPTRPIDPKRAQKRKEKRERQKAIRTAKKDSPTSPPPPPPPPSPEEFRSTGSNGRMEIDRPDSRASDTSTCTLVGASSRAPSPESPPGGMTEDQPVPPTNPGSILGSEASGSSLSHILAEAQLWNEALDQLSRNVEGGENEAQLWNEALDQLSRKVEGGRNSAAQAVARSSGQGGEGELDETQHLDGASELKDGDKEPADKPQHMEGDPEPIDEDKPVDESQQFAGELGSRGGDKKDIESQRQTEKVDGKMRKKAKKAARAAKRAEERAEELRKAEEREAKKREKKEQERRMKITLGRALDTPIRSTSSGSVWINSAVAIAKRNSQVDENIADNTVRVEGSLNHACELTDLWTR